MPSFLNVSKQYDVFTQVNRIKRQLNSVVDQCKAPVGQTMVIQASLVAAEQRRVAPIDPESENPGALRDSIRVEEVVPKKASVAIAVRIKAGGAKTTKRGKSGKPYDFARAVEFGTEEAPAYPFFFAIWCARKKAVRAAVRKAIKLAVRAVFR